jgi:hypothetical protein
MAATVVLRVLRNPGFLLHPANPRAIVFVETKDSARPRSGLARGATLELQGLQKNSFKTKVKGVKQ